MSSRINRRFFGYIFFIVFLSAFLAVFSCKKKVDKGQVSYVAEKDIPAVVAVLPAIFTMAKSESGDLQIDPESENGKFVAELVRGVVHNQLSGKGYETRVIALVDKKLKSAKKPWQEMKPEEICKLLSAEGLIYTNILSASMVTAVAFNLYSIDAQVRMVNLRGNELGSWTESSSRRKIAIPTGVVGAAATVAEAIMDKVDEAEKKNMRTVAYDWGWKMAQLIPDNPKAQALPEVISVVTNVDKKLFAVGDEINVEITGEKGLTCSFDIGDFRKDIPVPSVEDITYRGSYVVKEGDKAANQSIFIHMAKPSGISRIWLETGGTIEIDGVLPSSPDKVSAKAGKQGITLKWSIAKAEDIKGFVVERGDTAVGGFSAIATTNEQTYLDPDIAQGKIVYYRIRSVDQAGNKSQTKKSIRATMPFFDEVTLGDVIQGTIIPGVYKINALATVPVGETVKVEPGVRFTMAAGAGLAVKGSLVVSGEAKERVLFTGEDWKGISGEPGAIIELSNVSMNGCTQCIDVKGSALTVRSISLSGSKGAGLFLGDDCIFEVEDALIKGFDEGAVIEGGKGKVIKSTITGNKRGINLREGTLDLADNNIFGNSEKEIVTARSLVLDGNYLGASAAKDLKLEGKISVKSLLDAPAPQGRRIVLIDDKDVSPEELKAKFTKYKDDGIKAFQARKYGEAHESLSKAAALRDDKEVYLFLAYTQMSLGEDEALTATLEKGIKAYPYEAKLYQVYVRQLAAAGKTKEALALLDKALKLNPDDQGLKSLRESLRERPVPPPVKQEAAKTPEKAEPPVKEKEEAKKDVPKETAPDKEALFGEAKKQGIEAFTKRDFKKAEESLNQALSIKDDKDSYLYLAYTQMNLGEDEKLVATLKKAIKTFPKEVRLYQMYIRYLTNKGEKAEAIKVLEDAIKIAPEDPALRMQKEFLERGD